MSLGPMPGLDVLFYEALLVVVLLFEIVVLVIASAKSHARAGLSVRGRHVAIAIGVGPAVIAGLGAWLTTEHQLARETSTIDDLDIVHDAGFVMLGTTLVSFVAALLYIANRRGMWP